MKKFSKINEDNIDFEVVKPKSEPKVEITGSNIEPKTINKAEIKVEDLNMSDIQILNKNILLEISKLKKQYNLKY